jgi:N-acetylglutamate synthase-like GNAT family acetyltransferase
MIRQANKYDKTEIIEMLRLFRNESQIEQYKSFENVEYINRLLDQIIAGRGVAFIYPGVGMILGLIGPVLWCDKTLMMYEIAWYVKPEHRHGTTGYRLVQAYIKYGNKLKEEGRILLFTLSKLPATPNLNYEKLGFKKTDENWIQ